jgi:hypothetical protein
MKKPPPDLGKLISVHGTSPAFLQRAAIVAVLSFFFFMAMLLVFYIQQQMIYFVLSTAFLIVYIFTLIGWVMQKRNVVSIYARGITYRKFSARWDELQSVKAEPASGITISNTNGESVTIGETTTDLSRIALLIRQNLPG